MFGIETEGLVVILIIVLVILGPKKLPQLSRSIGESMRELRKGFNGDDDDKKDAADSKSELTPRPKNPYHD